MSRKKETQISKAIRFALETIAEYEVLHALALEAKLKPDNGGREDLIMAYKGLKFLKMTALIAQVKARDAE